MFFSAIWCVLFRLLLSEICSMLQKQTCKAFRKQARFEPVLFFLMLVLQRRTSFWPPSMVCISHHYTTYHKLLRGLWGQLPFAITFQLSLKACIINLIARTLHSAIFEFATRQFYSVWTIDAPFFDGDWNHRSLGTSLMRWCANKLSHHGWLSLCY